MKHDYDVIVVGAGPGGSTAARSCARLGLKTLLIEKEQLPRYKACGGCLSPKAAHLLDFDLSPVLENTIYGAKFSYCFEDSFFLPSPRPMAFMVMRDRFDHLLVRKALETGVDLLEGERVVRVEDLGPRVEAELERGEKLSCQYLIGADGAGSIVTRSLSLVPPKSHGKGIGLESEIPFREAANFPKEDFHSIHLDFGRIPNSFGWVFPKKEGLSVGIGGMFVDARQTHLHPHFIDFLKGLSYLHQGQAGRVVGHGLPSFYDEGQRVSRGRILLVGDAAYLIDPLTGEGIYYAIRSGMLAATSILQSDEKGIPASDLYQTAVRLALFENLTWALFFARFVNGFNKLSYQTLRHYPELGTLYLQVLEGEETYRGFLEGVKQKVKDFLKGRISDKIKRAIPGF